VTVADTGPGMTREELDKAFDISCFRPKKGHRARLVDRPAPWSWISRLDQDGDGALLGDPAIFGLPVSGDPPMTLVEIVDDVPPMAEPTLRPQRLGATL